MIPYYENGLSNFRIFTSDSMNFPQHMHTHIEVIYVIDGEIQVTIGSLTRTLKQGDFSIAFPNRIHSYHTSSSSTIILGLYPVEMSGNFMNSLLKQYPTNPFIDSDSLHKDIPYALQSCLFERDNGVDISVITAYFQLILARILPKLELKPTKDGHQPSLTAQLITYLSDNFTESLSLEHLGNHFGISKYSISRIFSDKLNTSLSLYMNTLRIDYAKTLLQQTDETVLTISYNCGYENSRTFNREFRRICGCTPTEFRKNKQEH